MVVQNHARHTIQLLPLPTIYEASCQENICNFRKLLQTLSQLLFVSCRSCITVNQSRKHTDTYNYTYDQCTDTCSTFIDAVNVSHSLLFNDPIFFRILIYYRTTDVQMHVTATPTSTKVLKAALLVYSRKPTMSSPGTLPGHRRYYQVLGSCRMSNDFPAQTRCLPKITKIAVPQIIYHSPLWQSMSEANQLSPQLRLPHFPLLTSPRAQSLL